MSDYGNYDPYGYDPDGYAQREFGQDCEQAITQLASARGTNDPIKINLGADCDSGYGPGMIDGCPKQFYQFCDALEGFPNDREIESVKFHHFNMTKGIRSKVKSALQGKNIKALTIDMCAHVDRCAPVMDFLSGVLESNQSLETLRVDTGILNQSFSDAVRDHQSLETIDLADFHFGEEDLSGFVEAIKDKADVTIRREYPCSLDNEMKDVHVIPGILEGNPRLRKLRLRGVNFCEGDIYHGFARLLATNTNLESLVLECYCKQILLKAIYNDESLNSIASSNHTCCIGLDPGGAPKFTPKQIHEEFEWVQGKEGPAGAAKKSKLLHAIGTFDEEGINVQRLVDIPLGLVPEVVEFVQDVSCFVESVQGVAGLEKIDEDKLARLALKNVFTLMTNIVAPLLPAQHCHCQHGLKRKRKDNE